MDFETWLQLWYTDIRIELLEQQIPRNRILYYVELRYYKFSIEQCNTGIDYADGLTETTEFCH